MQAIDTNVLIRLLTQDDEIQALQALQLIETLDGPIFVNSIVLCEVVWVLKSVYHYPKSLIVPALKRLISISTFALEHNHVIDEIIDEYEHSNHDFSDLMIGYINAAKRCNTTYTFDHKASHHPHFSFID